MFDDKDITVLIDTLTASVQNTKKNVIEGLKEGEWMINADSQRMIPYDSGDAYESWFSNVKVEGNEVVLTVGYDETGRFSDYLPLIHEVAPIAGGYGRKADANQSYTSEGFKLITDKPIDHEPQTKFLEKAINQNWPIIRDQKIKLDFSKG